MMPSIEQSPFTRALGALAHRLGAGWPEAVERVDVDGDGALTLTVPSENGARWFRFADEELSEVAPGQDPRVPLARSLPTSREGSRNVLAYRPRRRIVLDADSRHGLVSKGYRHRRSDAAAQAHIHAEKASAGQGFRVARLLRHHNATESLELERLDGDRILCTRAHADRFFGVGRALRGFQDADVGARIDGFGPREEIAVVDRWASRTCAATGDLPERWARERQRLERTLKHLPAAHHGLAHRDLHDGQLLETADGPALLDFDLLCHADVALDPANLLVHLGLRALQEIDGADEDAAACCGQAVLDGLDRSEEAGFWERLRFYQATTALRLALVYRLRPRWAALAPLLIALAGRCLDELPE